MAKDVSTMSDVRLAACLGICFCIGIHAARACTNLCQIVTSTTTITQKATFGYAALEHTGALKTAVDQGYGYAIQIFDKAAHALKYKTGCSVDSVAAGACRASTVITFTALANSANSAAAQVVPKVLRRP